MARPIRNVLTKITELFFQNVSPPWVFRVQQWFMTQINRTEREQNTKLSFFENSWICSQYHQKTVFWPLFRGLNQNVSPPWILKSHIRNLDECAAEKSLQQNRVEFCLNFWLVFSVNRVLRLQISYQIFFKKVVGSRNGDTFFSKIKSSANSTVLYTFCTHLLIQYHSYCFLRFSRYNLFRKPWITKLKSVHKSIFERFGKIFGKSFFNFHIRR